MDTRRIGKCGPQALYRHDDDAVVHLLVHVGLDGVQSAGGGAGAAVTGAEVTDINFGLAGVVLDVHHVEASAVRG